MPERTVLIENKNGLHARPAAEIVKLAAKFRSDITIDPSGITWAVSPPPSVS